MSCPGNKGLHERPESLSYLTDGNVTSMNQEGVNLICYYASFIKSTISTIGLNIMHTGTSKKTLNCKNFKVIIENFNFSIVKVHIIHCANLSCIHLHNYAT